MQRAEAGERAPGRDLDAHQAAPGPARRDATSAPPRASSATRSCARSRSRAARTTRAQRRLDAVLAEGRERSLFPERPRRLRGARGLRADARRTARSGRVPAALLRRYGAAARPAAPLGRGARRAVHARAVREGALRARSAGAARRCTQAHLVVANHDLLLRWPPDYPAFEHAIVDEVHELARRGGRGLRARGAARGGARALRRDLRAARRRRAAPRGEALLGAGARRPLERRRARLAPRARAATSSRARPRARAARRRLRRGAGARPARRRASPPPRARARAAAARIDDVLDARARARRRRARRARRARSPTCARPRRGLALAFEGARPDAVASFEGVEPPFDRWRLVVRPVAPGARLRPRAARRGCAPSRASRRACSSAATPSPRSATSSSRSARSERLRAHLGAEPVPLRDAHARGRAARRRRPRARDGRRARGARRAASAAARSASSRACAAWTRSPNELAPRLRGEGIEVLAPRRASDDPERARHALRERRRRAARRAPLLAGHRHPRRRASRPS